MLRRERETKFILIKDAFTSVMRVIYLLWHGVTLTITEQQKKKEVQISHVTEITTYSYNLLSLGHIYQAGYEVCVDVHIRRLSLRNSTDRFQIG